ANRDPAAGQVTPLLVGAAVDRVVEKVAPDAAVDEQGVALGRRSVADDPLAGAPGADEELEQLALGLAHLLAEGLVVGERLEAVVPLARAQRGDPRIDRLSAARAVLGIDAQRTAVGRQFLDVE